MSETILKNKSLVTPMQTAISLIRVKQNGSSEKVPICRSDQADLYYAIFDDDDCDFEISIDNSKCENRKVLVRLGFHNEKNEFICNKLSAALLETYESNGKKFHFVRQSSEDGKTLVAKATQEYGLTWNKASEMISQMTFEVEYSDPAFQIFYKDLIGNLRAIEVFEQDTIHEIKKQIEMIEGIPVNVQRLVFKSHTLEDCHMVKNYQIIRESTLHLLLRVLGGGCSKDPDKQSNSDIGDVGNDGDVGFCRSIIIVF